MKAIGIAIISFVFSSGCVVRGEDFSSNLDWINKDATSQQAVKERFGMPYQVGNSGGTPTWTYGYYLFRLFGESHTKELKFYWDRNLVKNYSFSSSFPKDRQNVLSIEK